MTPDSPNHPNDQGGFPSEDEFQFDSPDAPINEGLEPPPEFPPSVDPIPDPFQSEFAGDLNASAESATQDPALQGEYQDPGFALNEPSALESQPVASWESSTTTTSDSSGGFEIAPPVHDKAGADPLPQIKKFTEKSSVAQNLPAPYPFSLLISGHLTDREKEKLIDVLTREDMGIREVELEPQFQSGRILIPRISEYAGILLVQALRGTRAQIRLGPSDTIFATADTREELGDIDTEWQTPPTEIARFASSEGKHPAELVRISADPMIADLPSPVLIDLVIVSASLKSEMVEPRNSPKYQETLDALIRELKYRAHRKGAQAIVNFSIDLTMLKIPSEYKLTVKGSAIRSGAEPAFD
jgi:hypothetical protein